MKIFGTEFKFNGFDIWHSGNFNPANKSDIGHNHVISNIDNLQTTLDSKAPLTSPAFTGTPTAPTASNGTNTNQIATTAFVQNALSTGGYGDMMKSVYDKNNDGIVDNAEKVNGFTVDTNVPANAKFTDTTYSEITTSEIDAGTSSTLRTISGRRIKYILDKVQGWINALTKADVGLGNVDNIKQASKTEFDAHLADSVAHGTASKAEAQAGTSHTSYMTPLRTKEAIQALQSVASVNNKTGAVTLTKGDVGLGSVTNDAQLKIASNLSDLNDIATARTNLGLTGSSNTTHYHDSRYISKTNTTVFTPTADYHPATKKYVDDNAGGDVYHIGATPPTDTSIFWIDTSS